MRIQTEDLRFGVPVVSILISVNEGFRHVIDFDIQVFWSSTFHFLKQLFYHHLGLLLRTQACSLQLLSGCNAAVALHCFYPKTPAVKLEVLVH